MFLKLAVFVIFTSCVTMVLTKPGYGASSPTKVGPGYNGQGTQYGHSEPEPEPNRKEKDNKYYQDNILSGGKHDEHHHSPGAYDNDDHRQSGGLYSSRSGDRDGQRRSGGYDGDRHAPGAYDNDNHRSGSRDYSRERHSPGAYDNDNHRRSGGYDNDSQRRSGGFRHDASDESHGHHAPGAYDNDNHRGGRDQERHRSSHERAEAEPRGHGSGITSGSSYGGSTKSGGYKKHGY